jgi:DNA-directed RNA polymerase subunit M
MFPKDDIFHCNKCGYEKKKGKSVVVVEKQKNKETVIFDKKVDVLPKTRIKCPKCGHNEASWILRQMRGSDEPESRFYTCTKCNHTWRED